MSGRIPTLPNFLVIGAAKAGTTSLHEYLTLHPQIFMARSKSPAFFDPRLRWDLGVEWYKSNFDARFSINGEVSPQYTLFPTVSGVPKKIRDILGAPKLIYSIRDPIDRLLSEYREIMDQWPSPRPFDVTNIETDWKQSIQSSCYFFQLSQYLEFFPRRSIFVMLLERLKSNPRVVLREIFRFLGVDEDFRSSTYERRFNAGENKKYIAPWFQLMAPQFLIEQMNTPTWLPWPAAKVTRSISRVGGKLIARPEITAEDDLRLQQIFQNDVSSLREFLGDRLLEWRPYR